jgi:hypothetical protein
LEIKVSLFTSFFGKNIEKLKEEGEIFELIKKISFFHFLPDNEIYSIVRNIKNEHYQTKETIIKEGTIGEKMFIIKSGEVSVIKNDSIIKTMNKGAFFGEGALLTKEKRSATVNALSAVECYSFEANNFAKYINNNIPLKNYLMQLMKRKNINLRLLDLEIIKFLGNGSMGSVIHVRSIITKDDYGIKVISKNQIDNELLHNNLKNEKEICCHLIEHPFVMKIIGTMKDENFVYLVMEYIEGIDLIDVQNYTRLKLEEVKFLMASVSLAIEYIHSKWVIHRDIKPDNIIVNKMVIFFGYI